MHPSNRPRLPPVLLPASSALPPSCGGWCLSFPSCLNPFPLSFLNDPRRRAVPPGSSSRPTKPVVRQTTRQGQTGPGFCFMIRHMDILKHDEEPRSVAPLIALYSILGFWLFYMIVVTLRALVIGWEAQGEMARSEEHTSDLQSLMRISYAVFCLKKKKKQLQIHIRQNKKESLLIIQHD